MHYALVCGSREYGDAVTVRSVLGEWAEDLGSEGFRVIAGGAKGPDSQAVEFCQEAEVKYLVMKAQWDKYGNSAGFRRNTKMLELLQARQEQGHSVCVIAFWDGVSRGTGGMIQLALKAGITVFAEDQLFPFSLEEVTAILAGEPVSVGEIVEAVETVEPVEAE